MQGKHFFYAHFCHFSLTAFLISFSFLTFAPLFSAHINIRVMVN